MKDHMPEWGQSRTGQLVLKGAGIFLTFNFVSLGWLFFTLPTHESVWNVLAVLFGVA